MDNENYKVSIIIANYNKAEYIEKAINSALSQDFTQEYEIIIVDDNSTDNSVDIINSVKAKYPEKIQIVLNNKNRGVYKNYLSGMQIAKGEYITMLDADDEMMPEKLLLQSNVLDSNPEVSVVTNSAVLIDNINDRRFNYNYHDNLKDSEVVIFDKAFDYFLNFKQVPTFMFRSSMLEEIKLFNDDDFNFKRQSSEVVGSQDFVWLAQIAACGKIAFINKPLYTYVVNVSSITTTRTFDGVCGEIAGRQSGLAFLYERKRLSVQEHNILLKNTFLHFCYDCLGKSNNHAVLELLHWGTKLGLFGIDFNIDPNTDEISLVYK